MAKANFHSLRGEKSALIMVKANSLVFSPDPVYVSRAGVAEFAGKPIEELKKGDSFNIPDGYSMVEMPTFDEKTGKQIVDADGVIVPRTTKDGVPLKTLMY